MGAMRVRIPLIATRRGYPGRLRIMRLRKMCSARIALQGRAMINTPVAVRIPKSGSDLEGLASSAQLEEAYERRE